MNLWAGSGRLTKDPEIKWTSGDKPMCIARYTLAIPRKFAKNNEADFIQCKVFGKLAENTEKYIKKGTKLCVQGQIQTGSYTNREGQKVYTTEVVVEYQEFAESRQSAQQYQQNNGGQPQAQYNAPPQQVGTQMSSPQQYAPQAQAPAQSYGQQTSMFDHDQAYNRQPQNPQYGQPMPSAGSGIDGFMSIPDGISSDELPFA